MLTVAKTIFAFGLIESKIKHKFRNQVKSQKKIESEKHGKLRLSSQRVIRSKLESKSVGFRAVLYLFKNIHEIEMS